MKKYQKQMAGLLLALSSSVGFAAKAILFDTFGTVVDWRGSMVTSLNQAFKQKKITHIRSEDFADAWAGSYADSIDAINTGDAPFVTVDVLNLRSLQKLLETYQVSDKFTQAETEELAMIWHKLDAWPDAKEGLKSLRKSLIVGTLSNGNVRLLVDLSKYNHLTWDMHFSGESIGKYKPEPSVYLAAARMLNLEPKDIILAASHKYDLKAAQALGFKTAYLFRPHEFGETRDGQWPIAGEFDYVVEGIDEIAKKLA